MESVIIIIVVTIAGGAAAWRLYRALRPKPGAPACLCDGCGKREDCHLVNAPRAAEGGKKP